MHRLLLFFLCCVAGSVVLGQGRDDGNSTPASNSRDQVLRSVLALEKGEITVIEASSADGGVIIGYTSGALVACSGDADCRTFEGTPSGAVIGAVTDIAVSLRAGKEIIWAAYPHGVFYRCVDYACRQASP